MITALLIGFEYNDSQSLRGTASDILIAYHWCKSIGVKDIRIYTDIPTTTLNLPRYEPDVLMNLPNFKSNKLFIYYTGHGENSHMIMPSGKNIKFTHFRDMIIKKVSPQTEIFWILDCCNAEGLSLPFQLEDNTFRLTENFDAVINPILLITSCNPHEESTSTIVGSTFTGHLFNMLKDINKYPIIRDGVIPVQYNRNLRRLMGELNAAIRKSHTGKTQTVSIYSSYALDPVLWLWIGLEDVVSDIGQRVLIVRQEG